MFKSLIKFLEEARGELKKVSWPTREQVWESTVVVIFSVIVISIFLGIVDIFFSWLIKVVIGR